MDVWSERTDKVKKKRVGLHTRSSYSDEYIRQSDREPKITSDLFAIKLMQC